METKIMLQKVLERAELTASERVEILGLVRAEHIDEKSVDVLLKKDFLSVEQKIELLGKLVCEKAQKIILEEFLIASLGVGEKVDITLSSKDCRDSDTNIRKFLRILGAQDIQVSSDFPGYNESYEGRTIVKFRV